MSEPYLTAISFTLTLTQLALLCGYAMHKSKINARASIQQNAGQATDDAEGINWTFFFLLLLIVGFRLVVNRRQMENGRKKPEMIRRKRIDKRAKCEGTLTRTSKNNKREMFSRIKRMLPSRHNTNIMQFFRLLFSSLQRVARAKTKI